MHKKASIELSVGSIVTIILAIVFLGLSLIFLIGTYTKTQSKFEEQVSAEQEPPMPDRNNLITFSREKIISKAGNDEIVKVNTFNPTNKDWIFSDTEIPINEEKEEIVRLKIDCSEGLGIEKTTTSKRVEAGGSIQFTTILRIDKRTQKGTYLCKIGVEGFREEAEKYTKDLAIEIG